MNISDPPDVCRQHSLSGPSTAACQEETQVVTQEVTQVVTNLLSVAVAVSEAVTLVTNLLPMAEPHSAVSVVGASRECLAHRKLCHIRESDTRMSSQTTHAVDSILERMASG